MVQRRLDETGQTRYQVAKRAGLPPDAIRYVLRGHVPKLDRAKAICSALGIDFYIGPAGVAIPPEVTRALDLGEDCSVSDVVQAIERLADTMGAVQARANAMLEPIVEQARKDFAADLARVNREFEGIANLQGTLIPVDCVSKIRVVEGSADIDFDSAGMSAAVPLGKIPGWANHEELVFIRALGDSMKPDLSEGRMLLVDRSRSRAEMLHGQAFLIHSASGFIVRRLVRTAGPWLVCSLDESIPERALAQGDLLIGAAIWGGRKNPLWTDSDFRAIQQSPAGKPK